jgi:hypothetical protein
MRSLLNRSLAASGARRGAAASLLAASTCALALAAPGVASAKTINLNDTGKLRLQSSKGLKLVGNGSANGSISASLTLHVSVVSTNKVSVEVSISPKGGSLSGDGSGKYSVNGGTASFSGTLSITKGTGSYSKAKGSLKFNGTIQRTNKAVTVHVSGKLSV